MAAGPRWVKPESGPVNDTRSALPVIHADEVLFAWPALLHRGHRHAEVGLGTALAIVGQLSVQTDAATRAAPDGCNMIV